MKYISLTLMILSLLTGVVTIVETTNNPFTTDIFVDFYETEYTYLDKPFEATAWAYPLRSADNDLTWTSSNEEIAEITDIDEDYHTYIVTITPKKEGTVTITVKANEKLSKSFDLEIKSRPVTSVSITTTCPYTTITTGSRYSLTGSVLPTNASYKTLTWTSSNDNIITVDQEGNFTAVGEGTATITATSHNGLYDSKTYVVKDKIYIESINITDTAESLTLYRYNTRTLSFTYSPANANVLDFTWTTDNAEVVTVDEDGKIKSTGIFGDNVKITLKTSNGITDSIYVTVPEVHATSISIDGVNIVGYAIMSVGETLQLTCKKNPSNTTDPVVWTSSHPDIISVSQSGLVRALADTLTMVNGVTITATCGTKTATATIYAYK